MVGQISMSSRPIDIIERMYLYTTRTIMKMKDLILLEGLQIGAKLME